MIHDTSLLGMNNLIAGVTLTRFIIASPHIDLIITQHSTYTHP